MQPGLALTESRAQSKDPAGSQGGSTARSAADQAARAGSTHRTGEGATAVLELRVRNHPGTMSHITGLFARRAFNLEAIVCAPIGDGSTSCTLLLVANEPRLEQVERQLAKLHDVISLRHRPDVPPEFFTQVVSLPERDGSTR